MIDRPDPAPLGQPPVDLRPAHLATAAAAVPTATDVQIVYRDGAGHPVRIDSWKLR